MGGDFISAAITLVYVFSYCTSIHMQFQYLHYITHVDMYL